MLKFSETAPHGRPNLVAPTCVSPGMNISMHGIPACSQHSRKCSKNMSHYIKLPCGSMPLVSFLAFACSDSCDVCNFFEFSTFPPWTSFLSPFLHLIFFDHRSSLAMPHPTHRSYCTQVPMWSLSLTSLSPNLDLRRKILALRSSPPELRTTAPAPVNRH